MGHLINYLTVSKKSDIMDAAYDFAYYEGDRYEGSDNYHGNMHILDKLEPFDDYEKAVEYVEDRYRPYYDMAVRYVDYVKKPPTKMMAILKQRIHDIDEKLELESHKRNTQAKKLRVAKYNEKKEELLKKYEEAESRNRKKNGIYWLVKVEIHI